MKISQHSIAKTDHSIIPGKLIVVGVFLGCIFLKSLLLQSYLVMDGDRALQMTAAINWAKGLGYTIPVIHLPDINTVYNDWLLEWPPLYSLLLVPFLWLTGMDQVLSATILDVSGAILYLYAIWKLTTLIGLPIILQCMVLGFKATEFNEGILFSMPTDHLAAGSLFLGVYVFLKHWDSKSVSYILVVAFWSLAAFYFRYMYLPVIAVFPLMTIWNGVINKEWFRVKNGMLLGGILLLGTGGYFLMNYLLGEQVTYFGKWVQGFDLSRAMGIAPLFWHAIAHHVFIVLQLSYLFKVPYSDVSIYFFYSSLVILVPMVWKVVSGAVKNKCRMPASVFGRLVYVMFFPSLALVILLMYLSARILFDGGQGTGGGWTFVSEERYYLLPLLLILLGLIHWAFISGGTFARLKYLVGLFLWGALALQVLHVGWMLLKSRRERAEENIFYSIYTGNSRRYIDQLKKAADKHDADMVLFTSDYSNMYHGAMNNIKLMRHAQLLNSQTSLTATRPSLLVFFTYREPNSAHQAFIDRYGFKKTATIDTDYNCYISFINPQ